MELKSIVSNSIKYPFKNILKLPLLCILFILICIIPIGMKLENNYMVALGILGFLIFILIVPGYFVSIVKTGSRSSSIFPSFNLVENIRDSIKVMFLRLVYMIVPVIVFFIALSTLGVSSIDLLYDLQVPNFIFTLGLMLLLIFITYIIFEFLLFFAKARLAYFDSLSEALKIHKVIEDIRNIGIVNIIKWLILMGLLICAVSVVSSLVMMIPYVGFLIYACIVIPVIESIANYSLGLLYSNIAVNSGDVDFKKLEREIQLLKYEN